MMKIKITLALTLVAFFTTIKAADTLEIKQTRIPLLIERTDNVLFLMRLDADKVSSLEDIQIEFGPETDLSSVAALSLYYSGTEARQDYAKNRFAPVEYVSSHDPGNTLKANPSYSVLKDRVPKPKNTVTLKANQQLFPGRNFFWVSLQLKKNSKLNTKITAKVVSARSVNTVLPLKTVSQSDIVHRVGVGVRHAGSSGSKAYRIPGLVTTKKGSLLGVYDVRYNSSVDLQERVDIGLSRSTNGGRTWEKMRIPMTFANEGGLPTAQNGVGDPAILVDEVTGTVWIIAAWTHGMGNQRAWWSSQKGMTLHETAQLMLVKSDDDGKTWSEPINITQQVKDPSWYFLLQGPGRGITMKDGTLVFPIQFIDSTRVPNAGIMYSKDRGENWQIHNYARTNTTEAQVAETEPGVLMLNMRDNRGGSRAVSITRDFGKTWTEHSSNRSALPESVCQASLLMVNAAENVTGKDLLIFSNPNVTKGRYNTTIKISTDGGVTWPEANQLLLDEDNNWGYSCLTLIDSETIGILYESSVAHMTFQAVKIKDILK